MLCVLMLLLLAGNSVLAETAGFVPTLDTSTSLSLLIAGHYDNFEAIEAEFELFREYYPNVKLRYEKIDDSNFPHG